MYRIRSWISFSPFVTFFISSLSVIARDSRWGEPVGRGRIYIAFRGMDDAPAPDEGGNPTGLFFSGYYLSRPFKALKIRMDFSK